jgi:hypothetical protein
VKDITDPTQAKTVKIGYMTTRKYVWPPHPPHEFTVTSVTSAIGHGLPKPHLVGWAVKKTAEAAIRDHDIVGNWLGKSDKKAAVDHLKGARWRDLDSKADRGTIVHAAVDAYLRGKPYTKDEVQELIHEAELPRSYWESTVGMIAGAMEFLWEVEPEVIHNEVTLFSREHQYGGTADLICKMKVGGTIVPVVVDFKTSKAIYDEVALQLSAYGHADFVGGNDGSELPILPGKKKEPIKFGSVIRPISNGTYERADYILTDDVFEMFLACLKIHNSIEAGILEAAKRPTVQ